MVLLHCAAGQSVVAVRYTTLTTGIPARSALAELLGAHGWTVNPELRQVIEQL